MAPHSGRDRRPVRRDGEHEEGWNHGVVALHLGPDIPMPAPPKPSRVVEIVQRRAKNMSITHPAQAFIPLAVVLVSTMGLG